MIAPVPPLPPREVPNVVQTAPLASVMQQEEKTEDRSLALAPLEEATPPPPVKKIRTRKKAATIPSETPEPGSVVQAEAGASPAVTPPKRGRKKKTGGGEAIVPKDQEAKTSSEFTDPATARSTDVPAKPKRTRSVGEPKPKRYPVGEQEVEQGA